MGYWSGKRVLITGGAGFIGGNLAVALAREGGHVTAITRGHDPRNTLALLGAADEVRQTPGDVRDSAFCAQVLAEGRVTHVFHLAAQALVGVAARNPAGTFDSNVRGTWSLLDACRVIGGVESIVVASSDKAYGIHPTLPYREEACLSPAYPYDVSKACADLIARSYAVAYAQPVAVTRLANVYGPGDVNFTRLVPDAIRCAYARRPLILRSDGTMQRDYLHVTDAVRAYLMLAERLTQDPDGVAGRAFNFGSGHPVAVLGLVRAVLGVFPGAPEPRLGSPAPGEIPHQSLDSSRAERLLGWRPTRSLDEGLAAAAAWYSALFTDHPELLE